MIVRALTLACAFAFMVAGCTGAEDEPSPRPSTGAREVSTPKDRDADAVLGALRRIDTCAVLGEALAAKPKLLPAGAKPRARQPFRCGVDGVDHPVAMSFSRIDHATLLPLPVRDIGGAKAYLHQQDGCEVYLPVSFGMAMTVSQQAPTGQGSCTVVSELATVAVATLANPSAVETKPRWDACSALAAMIGTDVDESKLVGTGSAGPGFVECAYLADTPAPGAVLSFAATPLRNERKPATIAGTAVEVHEEVDGCDIYWRDTFQVRVHAAACAPAQTLAASAIEVLASPPPEDAPPQRPLFYAPDEPDSPYPGACAFVADADPNRCRPYADAGVPDSPAEIAKSAAADPMVACAVAVDAVGEQFTGLAPGAVSDRGSACYFVEPERRIQVEAGFDAGPPDTGAKEITIAGHPGTVQSGDGYLRYRIPIERRSNGWALTLNVRSGPVEPEKPLPAGTDTKAVAVLTAIVEAILS